LSTEAAETAVRVPDHTDLAIFQVGK
jgi:hypothetical protein